MVCVFVSGGGGDVCGSGDVCGYGGVCGIYQEWWCGSSGIVASVITNLICYNKFEKKIVKTNFRIGNNELKK